MNAMDDGYRFAQHVLTRRDEANSVLLIGAGCYMATGVMVPEPGWWALHLICEHPLLGGQGDLPYVLIEEDNALPFLLATIEHMLDRYGRLDALRAAVDRERMRIREIDVAAEAEGMQFGPQCTECQQPAKVLPDGTIEGRHTPPCSHYRGRRDG